VIQTTILGTAPTDYVLGTCEPCQRPVRATRADPRRYVQIDCPDCGAPVSAERLLAVHSREECGGNCMRAYRPHCTCACGGTFHGSLFGAEASREQLQAGLTHYRRRAETVQRHAIGAFGQWASRHHDVVAALTGPRRLLDCAFLRGMAARLGDDPPRPLTDNQTYMVRLLLTRRTA
jgi:hypothetical protein